MCVVLTADRGLCGGFNSNICKLAKTNFKKILNEGKELNIITVGSKGYDQIKREFSKHVIKKFEKDILEKIKSEKPEIIEAIQSTGKLEEETDKSLSQIIEKYKKENK